MSRKRVYSDSTLSVMKRFYEAFDHLRESKQIKNVEDFCLKYKIDKRHLYAQRQDLSKGYFEVGWITPLVCDYFVSSRWILTGTGSEFSE